MRYIGIIAIAALVALAGIGAYAFAPSSETAFAEGEETPARLGITYYQSGVTGTPGYQGACEANRGLYGVIPPAAQSTLMQRGIRIGGGSTERPARGYVSATARYIIATKTAPAKWNVYAEGEIRAGEVRANSPTCKGITTLLYTADTLNAAVNWARRDIYLAIERELPAARLMAAYWAETFQTAPTAADAGEDDEH